MRSEWSKKVRSGEDASLSMRFIEQESYKGRGFKIDDVDKFKVKMYDDPKRITLVVYDLFTRFIEDDITSEMLQSGAIESTLEINGRLIGESETHAYIAQHMYYDGQASVFGVPKGCIKNKVMHSNAVKKKK